MPRADHEYLVIDDADAEGAAGARRDVLTIPKLGLQGITGSSAARMS